MKLLLDIDVLSPVCMVEVNDPYDIQGDALANWLVVAIGWIWANDAEHRQDSIEDSLFREILSRGVEHVERPEDTPWKTRETTVVDPDGNRLRFANAGE